MNRWILPLLILLSMPASLFSQSSDFGIWYAAGGKLPITRYLDFKLEGDIRTYQDASKIDEGFGEMGFSLQTFRFLDIEGAYRLTSKLEDDNNYYLRHKFFAGLKAKTGIRRMGLSCRMLYEHQVKTYIRNENDEIPDNFLRIRLEAKYDIRKSKIEPIVYYESWSRILDESKNGIEKYRLSAGMAYRISKRQRVEISYIYQHDFTPDPSGINVISLSYDFKL